MGVQDFAAETAAKATLKIGVYSLNRHTWQNKVGALVGGAGGIIAVAGVATSTGVLAAPLLAVGLVAGANVGATGEAGVKGIGAILRLTASKSKSLLGGIASGVVNFFKDEEEILLEQAVEEYESDNHDAALKLCQKAININPLYSVAYFLMGCIFAEQEQAEDALRYYNKSIEINPEFAPAYNCRASTKIHLEQYVDAIKDYTKSIKLGSSDENVYLNRGQAYLLNEDYQEALSDFEKALRKNPECARAIASIL